MDIGEKLKETYFAWEEKWYGFLDKVDESIPVYKVVDKIDDVVPSFALLLILIFILFLLIILGTFGIVVAQQSTLKLTVVDSAGAPISTAQVSIDGIEENYFTNDFGLVRDIILPGGRSIVVTATKGDRSKTQTIWLNSALVEEQIVLPIEQISFYSRTIQFINQTDALITDELNLEFSCSSGATPPQPRTRKIYNGVANIEEPGDCGTLLLTITSQNYETKNVQITQSSRAIRLTESTPTETGRAIINLKFEDELIEESIRVSAYKATNPYIPHETTNSINGVAIFDLAVGDYIFETRSEQGYSSKSSEVINVNTQSDTITTINLEKDVVGKINVIVKRGNFPIEEALVTLRKGTSAIDNELTNSDGNVTFELGQTGPFIIVATKEGYCEEAKEADLGDTVEINLNLDTGNCGGELKIRVMDNSQRPVQFARALIFGETEEDEYKLNYVTKTTNYDGNASWNPVKYSEQGERYRVFAYKGSYSGWSEPFTFSSITQSGVIPVTINLEDGLVNVRVVDRDGEAVQFAEVQLFEDYGNTRVTGKRIIQESSGLINFNVRAGQRVYAVIEKEGYETYTTMPREVIGNSSINFEVTLARPPLEEIFVDFIGLYKNDKKVLQAQPGEDYLAIFELTAPKEYDELGFFIRAGAENVTKTEMDKIYIKELIVPGVHTPLKGASFNPPRGYNIDQDYLNLEESKWASATWDKFGYAKGKIRVGAIISIKQTARMEDLIEIGYRAWGRDTGYERDPFDSVLGTAQNTSQKQALYAATKRAYAWIGTESLCEVVGDNTFCVSATVTDDDGIRTNFDSGFDARNNAKYNLGIKVTNASNINFINTSTKLENNEDNLFIGSYNLISPDNSMSSDTVNGFFTEWLSLGDYRRDTEFSFNGLEITPRVTGYGTLLLRLRDTSTILFEKLFGVNIASDRKMTLEYLYDGEYITEMPQIASGTLQTVTLRALNVANGLEIDEATVKVYDRFSNKIFETRTNTLGIATIQIPGALPGERLRLQVEKPAYETKIVEFRISEDIVNITPQNLSFTVNPQTKTEDTETVKIENKTGFDLRIQNIEFSGKTRGLISTSRMESWFAGYVGRTILSNDYEEIDFKVISAQVVPTAGDIEGVFLVTVGNDAYSWVQEVDAKIRVGLGNDVDNANCLEISRSDWVAQTQGEEIEISFEIRNNCTVEGIPVQIINMGGMLEPSGNITGKFSAQSVSAYTELSRGFSRTFRPIVNPGEVVPVTVKFTPYGGTSGTTSGSITFQAINRTDSTDQILNTSIDYTIDIINSSCIVIGSDLVRIGADGESGSFSITNGCSVEASFQLQSDLALSNSTFTLSPGASQDVTITRNEGDIPGAYNVLVRGRLGSGRQELLGNVKVILDIPADSCFTLSRFEYDIFDSPYSEFDGVDRGYLRNTCTQKPVSVSVYGDEGWDWDKVLRDMLVGAVAGYLASGEWTPWDDKISEWLKKSRQEKIEEGIEEEEHLEIANDRGRGEILSYFNEAQINDLRMLDEYSTLEETSANGESLETQSDQTNQINNISFSNNSKDVIILFSQDQANREVSQKVEEIRTLINRHYSEITEIVNLSYTEIDEKAKSAQTSIGEISQIYSSLFEKTIFEKQIPYSRELAEKLSQLRVLVREQEISSKTTDLQRQLTELKSELSEKNEEFRTNEASRQEAIVTLEEELERVKSEKETLEGRISNLDSSLEENAQESENLRSRIRALSETETELEAQVTSLREQNRLKESRIAELEKQLERVSRVSRAHEQGYTTQARTIGEKNAEITRLQSEISALRRTSRLETCNVFERSAGRFIYRRVLNDGRNKCEFNILGDIFQIYDSEGKTIIGEINHNTLRNNLEISPGNYRRLVMEYRKNYNSRTQKSYFEMTRLGQNVFFVFADNGRISSNLINIDNKLKPLVEEWIDKTNNNQHITKNRSTLRVRTSITNFDIFGFAEQNSRTGFISRGPGGLGTRLGQIHENYTFYNFIVGKKVELPDLLSGESFLRAFNPNENFTIEGVGRFDTTGELLTSDSPPVEVANNNNTGASAAFLLAVPPTHRTQEQPTGWDSFSGIGNTLTQMIPSIGAGVMGGSALGGALLSGLVSIMMGQDNVIQYSDTFVVPLIDDISVSLQSDGGVRMSVGDVTYDYDQYYQNLTQQAMGGGATYQPQVVSEPTAGTLEGQGLTQRAHDQGILFNPQALRATLGLVEVRELEFRNGGQNNPNPYEPFVGIITVTGKEKVYESYYDYKEIERAAKERGEFKEKKQNWFLEILNPQPKRIANMTEEDLEVAETRDYETQFRVLFNSYEYVECGPNTYPCAPPEFASCTVGSKSGVTGPDAAPRLLLNWEWDRIAIDQCDESNPNYTYCDVTQATISTLKKVSYLKNFFNQNTLTECPTAIDTLGTRSQSLNTNTIDVAITNIRFIENNGNYEAEIVVRTNNAQEIGGTIELQVRRDGTIVQTSEKTKTFTTSATYNIPIDDNIGTGRFDVTATLDPQLCVGCQNNDTTNDSITSTLLIGASGVQECQSYDTRRDNFEKVLAANNITDPNVLEYVNFNINLTRDSFSEDFKKDLDAYLYDFAVAPQDYVQDLRELFLSDKFGVKWANEPGAWRAGKYNARLVIEFNNENWQWNDNNDIKAITMHLEYWGDPVPYNPIYNVSFNGTVGLHTDNGRQGYGASYNQLTEREFVVTEGARTIRATPNPLSNTPTRVNVSVDESFYNMNFTRPGNVLTVQRIGEDVELTLSPSIAVPVILDITRNQALDAYAYYSVDVDGGPQTTGSSLFRWNGIGQGCVAHDGRSMTTYVNTPDEKNPRGDGYGLRWDNTEASGTSSFYSTFYVPEKSSVRLRIMSQSESANFVSTHGTGQQIVVDSGEGVRSLRDVFDAVRNEEICVIGGEYFWNSETVLEPLKGEITSRENTCMTMSN